MRLTSWIDSLRHRLASPGSRHRWRSASRNVEALEDRTLLSVTSLFVNGVLSVTATSGESIRITTDTTLNAIVEVDGEVDTNLPQVLASSVEQIEVTGGDGDNAIDLIDVRSAIFSYTDPGTGSPMSISVNGGDGQDTIDGSTDMDDVLFGGDGDDVIRGGNGNNHLDGGDGNDNLSGGAGNDNLVGEDGQDTLRGENGIDTLSGGNGRDSLMGDAGDDSIDGGHGHDTILGGSDNDSLNGGDGRDSISGGAGDDSLTGGIQADTLIGGTGDDTALGNTGDDYLEGGTGDDLLVGGTESDTLLGESGDDKLNGQRDNDSLDAGLGNDTIFGGQGNDSATGGDGDDTIHGQGGNDFLFDDTGDDLIKGGTGRDLIDSRGNFFTVDDVQLDVEGSAGETSLLTFTVTLTGSITSPATVDYTSLDSTATAGADYLPVTGTLIFQPGTSTRTIDVTIFGDGLAESDEIFFLKLSNAIGAKLFDDTGEGRIIDDEPPIQVGTTVNVTRKAGYQGEVAIAVNPTNDQNIIVAPIDIPSISANNGRDAVWVTSNGGTSWQRVVIPNPVGQTNSAGDPTITFDRFGNALYGHMTWANLDQTNSPLINLASAFSSDGGQTWTAGVITSGDNRDDKPWVAAGPEVNNLSQDVFYVTWMRNGIMNSASSTDGVNWSPVVAVSDSGDQNDPTPTVDHNGVVTTCWLEFENAGEAPIECDISFNGGISWGTDRTAWTTSVNGNNDPFNGPGVGYLQVPVQPDRRILATISLDYDHSNGPNRGRLYLAFFDQGDLDGDPDATNATDHHNLDVFVITSDDNGNTWSQPTRVNDDTGVTTQFHSWLSVDPVTGKVGVFWQDARNDDGGHGVGDTNGVANDDVQIYASFSDDGGVTWNQNIQISAPASNGQAAGTFNFGEYIGADFYDNKLHMVWTDNSNSTGDNPDGSLSSPDSYYNTLSIFDITTPPPSVPPPVLPSSGTDTLKGGNGNDTILAGISDDLIYGGTAKDSIDGGLGDDTIRGEGGRDTIDGGDGDDEIRGNQGNDVLNGGAGDDHLIWSPGEANDTPSGGAGFDTLEIDGTPNDDSYFINKTSGGSARTQITDGTHTVTLGSSVEIISLKMGNGDDTVTVTDLKGVPGTLLAIYGETGNDTLTADGSRVGTVRMLLDGGDGNDTLTGSIGNDSLFGGDGDDSMQAGDGHDTLEAGPGDDLVFGGLGRDVLKGEDGNDTLEGNTGDDSLVGGEGDDSLTGGYDDDTIIGGEGDDELNGQRGNDVLYGDIGADTLRGGSGDDLLDGGLNDDRLLANDGDDTLRGDDGNDELHGHDGNDLIGGGDGNDIITGSNGADLINGGDGDDYINSGGDGNDTLFGGSGSDVILGENGNDRAFGQGSTNDTLSGGEGSDTLVGLPDEIDEAFTLETSVFALLSSV